MAVPWVIPHFPAGTGGYFPFSRYSSSPFSVTRLPGAGTTYRLVHVFCAHADQSCEQYLDRISYRVCFTAPVLHRNPPGVFIFSRNHMLRCITLQHTIMFLEIRNEIFKAVQFYSYTYCSIFPYSSSIMFLIATFYFYHTFASVPVLPSVHKQKETKKEGMDSCPVG